jgi:hypothetical protein
MTVLHGEFDPVTGAELKSRLEAETNRLFHADGGRDNNDGDDAGDARTTQQRRADALCALITGPAKDATSTASAKPVRPVHPVRYQVLVIATAQDGEITGGHLVDGSPVPLATLQRLACQSDLYALLFSQQGEPLWHGNRIRLATDGQWRALIARDGGCAICNAAPSRCEAHHIVPWQTGGGTDITNLVLLCRHHHHLVHDNGHQIRKTTHHDTNTTSTTTNGWELVPP